MMVGHGQEFSKLYPRKNHHDTTIFLCSIMFKSPFFKEIYGFLNHLLLVLSRDREWMGMGVAGMIVSQWIIPENSLSLAPVRLTIPTKTQNCIRATRDRGCKAEGITRPRGSQWGQWGGDGMGYSWSI